MSAPNSHSHVGQKVPGLWGHLIQPQPSTAVPRAAPPLTSSMQDVPGAALFIRLNFSDFYWHLITSVSSHG
jgi:hypothetical protein